MQRSKVAGLVIAMIILLVGVPALVWANSSGGDDHHRPPGFSRMHDPDRGHAPPSWAHGHHAMADKHAAKGRRGLTPMKEECDRPLPPGLAKPR
jgi:hypothetical protein